MCACLQDVSKELGASVRAAAEQGAAAGGLSDPGPAAAEPAAARPLQDPAAQTPAGGADGPASGTASYKGCREEAC